MSLTYTDGIRWMTIFMYHGIYVLLQGTMVPKTCMGIPWYYKCFYPSFISSQLISWYLLSLECLSSCKCTDYTLSDAFIIVLRFILWTPELLLLLCSSRVQVTYSSFNFSFATSSCYSSSSSSSPQVFPTWPNKCRPLLNIAQHLAVVCWTMCIWQTLIVLRFKYTVFRPYGFPFKSVLTGYPQCSRLP